MMERANKIGERLQVTGMHNRESYAALSEFVKSALALLQAKLSDGEQIAASAEEQVGRDTKGDLYIYDRVRPDLVQFAVKHLDDMVRLPQYSKAIESLGRNQFVRRTFEGKTYDSQGNPVPNADISPLVGSLYVIRFLYSFIERHDSFEFKKEDLDQLYETMEEFLEAEERQYIMLAPIHNFESAVDTISLTNELEIRQLTLEELNKILKANKLGQVPIIDFLQFKFAAVTKLMSARGKPLITEHARERIDRVISALRIWKFGAVGISVHYLIPTNVWELTINSIIGLTSPRFVIGFPYTLTESDASEFKKFFGFIEKSLSEAKSKELTFLDIALKRFNGCMEAIEFEDRLIDAMICLEAMLLGDDEVAELPYRLSLRAAALLGSTEHEIRHVQKFLKKVYEKLRNKIFHGRKPKELTVDEKPTPIGQVLTELEKYMRSLVLAFIRLAEHYKSHEEILEAIDEAVVSVEARAKLKAKAAGRT
jgi:hypothetical protein